MYLVDTNTVIYLFKGKGNVFQNMNRVSSQDISISILTFYELQVGLAKSQAPERQSRQINLLVDQVIIAEFDTTAAIASAAVRAGLEAKGTPIGPVDTLIAGTAISLNATLVTHNTKEFQRVPGLSITDWF